MSTIGPTETGTLVTADGIHLHTQRWMPPSGVDGIVLLVHGYGEHCGRYGHVARTFTDVGAAVCAYDQRGYGRSDGRRAYVDSFEHYVSDLKKMVEHTRSTTPDRPLFLFGHSMGGLVVLKYVLEYQPTVAGLLLSAPAIEINPNLAPVLRHLAKVVSWIAPTLPTTASPEGAISRDPEVVAEAKNDPLNYHGRVLARTGAEMLRAGDDVQSRLEHINDPFLVIHGTADKLASPRWSEKLYEEAASSDKTLTLYEGLYHETFNEPEQDRVLADLGTWLQDHLR